MREQFRTIWRELSQGNCNRISCANTLLRGSLFVNMWSVGERWTGGVAEGVGVHELVIKLELRVS